MCSNPPSRTKVAASEHDRVKKHRLQHFRSFPRDIYIKTDVFSWSFLFILFTLRPFNEVLLFLIFQEKPITANLDNRNS